jgi:hypothetical protein
VQWPPAACIVYPISGEIKLTDQHADLARVIRGAIKAETKYVLWTNAYPSSGSRTERARQWLYEVTKEKGFKAIKKRVREDDDFVRAFQDLVFPIYWSVSRANDLNFVVDICSLWNTLFYS